MPHDRQELSARVAAARPKDALKGGAFVSALNEARLLLPQDERLEALVRSQPARGRWVELFNYPVADFLTLIWGLADLMEPKVGPAPQPLRHLGQNSVRRWVDTTVGRLARSGLEGRSSPLDLIAGGVAIYKVRMNYGSHAFRRLSPTMGIFELRGDFIPAAYHQGVVEMGGSMLGHSIQVESKVHSLFDCDVVLTWDGKPPAAKA